MNVELKPNEFLIKLDGGKIFTKNPHGENKETYDQLKQLLTIILNQPTMEDPREFINMDDSPLNDGNGNNWPDPPEEDIPPEEPEDNIE
jgi:hypothetical protein